MSPQSQHPVSNKKKNITIAPSCVFHSRQISSPYAHAQIPRDMFSGRDRTDMVYRPKLGIQTRESPRGPPTMGLGLWVQR